MTKKILKIAITILLVSMVALIIGFSLLMVTMNIIRKLNTKNITAEGYLTVEKANCPGITPSRRNRYPSIGHISDQRHVLHSSTTYMLISGGDLTAEKQPYHFRDKRIRVQGDVDGTLLPICLDGKDQQIPLMRVTDIKPL